MGPTVEEEAVGQLGPLVQLDGSHCGGSGCWSIGPSGAVGWVPLWRKWLLVNWALWCSWMGPTVEEVAVGQLGPLVKFDGVHCGGSGCWSFQSSGAVGWVPLWRKWLLVKWALWSSWMGPTAEVVAVGHLGPLVQLDGSLSPDHRRDHQQLFSTTLPLVFIFSNAFVATLSL